MPPNEVTGHEDKNLRDALPGKYRDLTVEIITRIDVVDITGLVLEFSLFEAIDSPFIYGELIFADNSGLTTALPIIGQEEVRIKFTRQNETVDKTFACTDVKNIEKVLGESAGVVLSLTSQKHLINSVSMFSKSYTGLASDIIQQIHSNYFKEEIEIKSPSGSAHNVVFPFTKPYAAIKMIQSKTFGDDGTPYFLFENLFGEKPILQSMESMLKDVEESKLPILTKAMSTNKDEDGQGSRNMPETLGRLLSYEIQKNADTLKLLSGGALINNTIRLNISNNEYSETQFNYETHAKTIADLDPYALMEINEIKLDSNELKASISMELYNPVAFDSEGVTELGSQADVLSATKVKSRNQRMNNMLRVSAYADSDPINYQVGKCVNLIIAPNLPGLEAEEAIKDELFSGPYIITRLRHYIKNDNYNMSMELVREGLSKPKSTGKGGGHPSAR